MGKALKVVVMFVLVIGIAGCATLPMESNLKKPVSMTRVQDTQGQQFVEVKQAFWLFGGLIELAVPKLDEVIGPVVADHTGIQNLKITTEFTFIDIVINALTSDIVHSQTVIIEGEVYD